jgi:hypothetical protein
MWLIYVIIKLVEAVPRHPQCILAIFYFCFSWFGSPAVYIGDFLFLFCLIWFLEMATIEGY